VKVLNFDRGAIVAKPRAKTQTPNHTPPIGRLIDWVDRIDRDRIGGIGGIGGDEIGD